MATNPKKITLFNKVTKQQLNTLADGTSITKGSDTLTPQEGVGYLIPDTSVSFEAQTLTTEQKAQARTNIGVDTAINNAISSVYKIQGSETVTNLNNATKSASMNGYVYNISTGGTLNNQNASTLTVVVGDNVLFVWASGSWYWDKLAGDIDLTGYVQKTDLPATTTAGQLVKTTSTSGTFTSGNSLPYLTTAPSAANTDGGLILVFLSADPATKYSGYLYFIEQSNS